MYEDENLALEDAENVEEVATEQMTGAEEPTEGNPNAAEGATAGNGQEPEKIYTEEEFNRKLDEVLSRKIARSNARIRKDYERKYGQLETVLRAGTGKDDVGEITADFRQFYEGRGVRIPEPGAYSQRDMEVLAQAEADEVIKSGLDDVIEEVDRLAGVGAANMTPREKLVFTALAGYRQKAERANELAKLGVSKEVYSGREFTEFAGKFNPDTPVAEIYEMYSKLRPKKETKTMGSMRNAGPKETGVKDFYTRDEALKFTKKDFDRNPELFKAVERSMRKW